MEHTEVKFKGSDESTVAGNPDVQIQPHGGIESQKPDIKMGKAGPEHKGPFKQPHAMHTDEQGNMESHEPPTNPMGPNKDVKMGGVDLTQGDQLK